MQWKYGFGIKTNAGGASLAGLGCSVLMFLPLPATCFSSLCLLVKREIPSVAEATDYFAFISNEISYVAVKHAYGCWLLVSQVTG